MSFNFSGVEEAKGSAFTAPGTIAVFKIEKVEFNASKNKGTLYMGVFFKRKEDGFNHSFFMTEKALPRVKSLVKAATGKKLEEEINEAGLIAMLTGKEVAVRVSGKISDNGKAYADLPFGDFATSPDKLEELTFSGTEKAQIAKCLDIIASGNVGSDAPAGGGEAPSEFAASTAAGTPAPAPATATAPAAAPAPKPAPAATPAPTAPAATDDIF